MSMIGEIYLLFKRRLLETLRQPVWLISELMTPVLYLVLFSPLLKNMNLGTDNVLDIFIPGMLVLLAFSSGTGIGWTIIWELQGGVIERLRVTPVRRFSLMMGTVVNDVFFMISTSIIVIFISWLFGLTVHILGLIILLILVSLLTAMVSAVCGSLGLILKQVGSLAAVITGLQLPIMLLGGILLPLEVGPQWLQNIAHINPLYYAVKASRVLSAGTILDYTVLEAFLVIVPLTILAFWWSTRVYNKAVA